MEQETDLIHTQTQSKLKQVGERLDKKVGPYVGRLIKAVNFKASRDNSSASTDVESGLGSPANSGSGQQKASFKAAVSGFNWQNLNVEVEMSDYEDEEEGCF